jgi:hypothetical protein
MELIDYCIRWLLYYALPLLDIRDQFDDVFAEFPEHHQRSRRLAEIISEANIPEGPGSPISLHPTMKNSLAGVLGLNTAINHFIPTACHIIINAFTARRRDEVSSIRVAGLNNDDCISHDG